MSTNTKHKYNSPMKRIYYQSSSGGRPRDPSGDSEAMDLAKSLINFSDEIRQTAYSDAEHNKKDAQVVFDTLKAQGITDPDEIKKLIVLLESSVVTPPKLKPVDVVSKTAE